MRKLHVVLMTTLVLIVTLLGLLGCSNREAAVVGDWKDDKGSQDLTTFKADHTVSGGKGQSAMTGTWSLNDKTVTIKLLTLGGKPASDLKAQLDKAGPAIAANPALKKQMDDIEKMIDTGLVIALSDDGKKMTATILGQTETMSKVEAKS